MAEPIEKHEDEGARPFDAHLTLQGRPEKGHGCERIRGHSEIAPGGKADPGPAFDWARYRAALQDSEEKS